MDNQTLTNEELLKEFKRLLEESDKIEASKLGIQNLSEQTTQHLIDALVFCNQTLLNLTDKVDKCQERINSYEGRSLNSMDTSVLRGELNTIQEDLKKMVGEQFILLKALSN